MKSNSKSAFLVRIAALFPLFALGIACSDSAPQRPNIVFLLIDDLGWSDLSVYGHPFHETPVIDGLAQAGMRFTDFYATSPVCSPTRSSIQTGQYPARTGITDFIQGHWRPFEKLIVPEIDQHLKESVQTLGDTLQSAGYTTGYFGKWHLGKGRQHFADQHGYDMTEFQLGQAFIRWREHRPHGPKTIDFLTDATLWFIEKFKDKPFFVTLSHLAVHIPVEANEHTIAKYEQKAQPEAGVNHPVYAAMIEDLDTSIGRILALLDALGLSERTIVILASENGGLHKVYTGLGEVISTNAPLRGEKGTLYEGGIRVPLIVRWPSVTSRGSVSDEITTAADLFSTLCEMASAGTPSQEVDGVSLLGLLEDPDARLDRGAIYFHYPHYHHSRPAGAIRAGDWKLIEFFDDGSLELYNLANDIGEEHDLSESQPERAQRMQRQLASWRSDVGARMPRVNPEYDPEHAPEWWDRRTGKPRNLAAAPRKIKK